jgi:spermidine synthase / saccharopine dehydrogenase (NADP+, L-glutamate-forming)
LHAAVVKSAIKGKTHVVTTSYVSPKIRKFEDESKKAGILLVVVMNEIGLDPGIDHLYAIKTITEVQESREGREGLLQSDCPVPYIECQCRVIPQTRIKEFLSYCGALPAPEISSNPLGRKFSWSTRGFILGMFNSASSLTAK